MNLPMWATLSKKNTNATVLYIKEVYTSLAERSDDIRLVLLLQNEILWTLLVMLLWFQTRTKDCLDLSVYQAF